MLTINGVHECKADAKGRVALPAPLRKQLNEIISDGFVLKRSVFQPCLELYPMQAWNQVMTKVNRLNRFVKKNNDFIRRFSAGVKIIELDSSGRILIPKDLLLFGGIESDLVLASAVDIIEIWDKSAYEQSVSNDAGDFGTLAEEVMGELKYDEPDVS
jgi:MraZ protein